ncbi:GntR family transcriptional regulator [Sphingomonas sp. Mn802worker]|uniref:GntR family transcriptional regulator n=1 Tax=Sphingomonas sp. Mn802worker TaxID=629773 RepID=UPI000381E7EA|nr:GntR family transcriptional regulator [Sphingomonas sp. Mn802worker]
MFEVIRADIMALRIAPDTRISIDSLVRRLGVSQTPIREALSMLEAIGLVTKRHFVGYCSAPQLNREQFNQLYEARLLIEPFAARCAAERMGDDALRTVVALASEMKADAGDARERFAYQDSELHDLVAAGSGNPILRDALSRLHSHLHIFRLRSHGEVTSEAINEHNTLIDALGAHDGDAAEAAMREHIRRSYDRIAPFADE